MNEGQDSFLEWIGGIGTILLLMCFLAVSGVSCTEKLGNSAKLKACANQHNVYECEFVAVPKKGE